TDGTATGDAALDYTLELLRKREGDSPLDEMLTWAHGQNTCLRDKVRDRLVEKGVVRHDEGRILWLLPQHRYAGEHGSVEVSLIERLQRVLILGQPADRRTGALLALLASCYTSDTHLRERLFAELRDRMY